MENIQIWIQIHQKVQSEVEEKHTHAESNSKWKRKIQKSFLEIEIEDPPNKVSKTHATDTLWVHFRPLHDRDTRYLWWSMLANHIPPRVRNILWIIGGQIPSGHQLAVDDVDLSLSGLVSVQCGKTGKRSSPWDFAASARLPGHWWPVRLYSTTVARDVCTLLHCGERRDVAYGLSRISGLR